MLWGYVGILVTDFLKNGKPSGKHHGTRNRYCGPFRGLQGDVFNMVVLDSLYEYGIRVPQHDIGSYSCPRIRCSTAWVPCGGTHACGLARTHWGI